MSIPKQDSLRDPAAQAARAWRLSQRKGAAQAAHPGRRQRISSDLLALSWPICLVLALVAFTVFQYLLPAVLGPQDAGAMDLRYLGWSLSGLFLLFAAVAWRTAQQPPAVPAALLEMPWLQFESLLGEIFRMDGYTLIETRSRAEHFDLTLGRAGNSTIVHGRRWRRKPVDEAAVQELLSEMIARQVDTGALVSTSSFTPAARELAQHRGIRLIAGLELARLALLAQMQQEFPAADAPSDEAPARGQPAGSSAVSSVKSRKA